MSKGATYRITTLLFTAAALFFAATSATAQENHTHHWQHSKIIDYTSEKLHKAEDIIDKRLDTKDSLYVAPNLYNMTILTQYSYNYEYYKFSTPGGKQGVRISPENNNKIGLYAGWRWIFAGWSFDLTKNSAKKDFNFSFYTAAVGIDLFYRKRSEGYTIRRLNGFYQNGNEELTDFNRRFDGLTVKQNGVNLYYIFNNKRFSYRAAYSQTTNQRISTGSFILGLTYNEQEFLFDHSRFDTPIREQLDNELKFENVRYKDFSINFGYSYNWVFKKDFLANISLTPAIGYKNTSLNMKSSKEFLSSINFDLITRAAVVYNNSRYYIGTSLVSHTYSYNKSTFSILNGFGVINVYFGVNFWRRK